MFIHYEIIRPSHSTLRLCLWLLKDASALSYDVLFEKQIQDQKYTFITFNLEEPNLCRILKQTDFLKQHQEICKVGKPIRFDHLTVAERRSLC